MIGGQDQNPQTQGHHENLEEEVQVISQEELHQKEEGLAVEWDSNRTKGQLLHIMQQGQRTKAENRMLAKEVTKTISSRCQQIIVYNSKMSQLKIVEVKCNQQELAKDTYHRVHTVQ